MAEVVVAFDVAAGDDALRLADRLPGLRWAKVGPMLFLRSGARLITELKQRDVKVFLDLKWHDIPHAVAGAVEAARDLDVDLATVHALGGREMLKTAQAAAGSMRIAAVTVLTSHDPLAFGEAIGRDRPDLAGEAARLVRVASESGIGAIVTSPHEVAALRPLVGPDTWFVVPGIRLDESPPDDQRRTADPRTAVLAGATHLVVGRPITRSDRPDVVYNQICEAIA